MLATNNATIAKHEIYVNEISFSSREEINLFGFLFQDGKFFETQYVIARKELQTLFSNNQTGIEILWHIEKLFLHPHQVPATLNLIDLFGTTQIFEAQNIEMDVPFYVDETGELKPCESNELLFVEKIVPLSTNYNKTF